MQERPLCQMLLIACFISLNTMTHQDNFLNEAIELTNEIVKKLLPEKKIEK